MISQKTIIAAALYLCSCKLYGMDDKKETSVAQIYIKIDTETNNPSSTTEQSQSPADHAAARNLRRKNLNAAKAFVIKQVSSTDEKSHEKQSE